MPVILDQIPPRDTPRFALLSPVQGDVQPLSASPMAIDRLAILGCGVQLYPHSPVICAPAGGCISAISTDRRCWEFICHNQLRLRLIIHSPAPLPLATPHVKKNQVVPVNTPLFSLSAACLQQDVRLTLNVAVKESHALYFHYGRHFGEDDPLISIFSAHILDKPSILQTRDNHK